MYCCRRKRTFSQLSLIMTRLFAILSVEAIKKTTSFCTTTPRTKYAAWSDARTPSLEYTLMSRINKRLLRTRVRLSAEISWSRRKALAKTSLYHSIKSESASNNSRVMARTSSCSTSNSSNLSLSLTSMVWRSMQNLSFSASTKDISKKKTPNHHSISLLTIRRCWRKKLSGNRYLKTACPNLLRALVVLIEMP